MGERLVVNIIKKQKRVANLYYHWSAYTIPAINIVHSIYHHVIKDKIHPTEQDLQLALIRFAEKTTHLGYFETVEGYEHQFSKIFGSYPDSTEHTALKHIYKTHGGVPRDECEYVIKKFPLEPFDFENVSRSEGLVSITDEGMESSLKHAIGIITIDLDNQMVQFGMFYDCDIQTYLEETEYCDAEDFIPPDEVPISPVNLSEFTFDDLDFVHSFLNQNDSEWLRYGEDFYQIISG